MVIDFMAPGCGPCIEIAPVFAECAKENPTKGVFLEVDVTEVEVTNIAYTTRAFDFDSTPARPIMSSHIC